MVETDFSFSLAFQTRTRKYCQNNFQVILIADLQLFIAIYSYLQLFIASLKTLCMIIVHHVQQQDCMETKILIMYVCHETIYNRFYGSKMFLKMILSSRIFSQFLSMIPFSTCFFSFRFSYATNICLPSPVLAPPPLLSLCQQPLVLM